MIDWDKHVLAPLERVFGEAEPVDYLPATGDPFEIAGVFDEAYREVDLASGTGMTSQMPVLGVRLSLFPNPPKQGDRFTIRRLSTTYKVKEVRADSHGYAKLMANAL